MTGKATRTGLVIWTVGEAAIATELRDWFAQTPAAIASHSEFRVHHLANDQEWPDGEVDIVMGCLTTSTWSRARHVTPKGPPPLRSSDWPWGFPWLSAAHRETVEEANDQFHDVLNTLRRICQSFPGVHAFFFHPEDLGVAELGRPASPWQLPLLRDLAREFHMIRMAVYQCEFGESSRPAPMGILATQPLLGRRFARGWPLFRGQRGQQYIGPLADTCTCGLIHQRRADLTTNALQMARGGILQFHFGRWLCNFLWRDLMVEPEGHLRKGGSSTDSAHRLNEVQFDDLEDNMEVESDATWDTEVPIFESGFDELHADTEAIEEEVTESKDEDHGNIEQDDMLDDSGGQGTVAPHKDGRINESRHCQFRIPKSSQVLLRGVANAEASKTGAFT